MFKVETANSFRSVWFAKLNEREGLVDQRTSANKGPTLKPSFG